jgi:hypothetical protein
MDLVLMWILATVAILYGIRGACKLVDRFWPVKGKD